MKIRVRSIGFVLALLLWVGPSIAWADELVRVSPGRAAGTTDEPPPLLGFLARPEGPGRFPAVILLHGCPGFGAHEAAAAATLKSWGYVALALDSASGANRCAGDLVIGAATAMRDSRTALRYLNSRNFVASTRIALMGWSMGGTAALLAVDKGGMDRDSQAAVRGVIAWYPDCGSSSGILTVPALILVGERDDWTPAAPCQKLAAHESDIGITRDVALGTPIDLIVYANATHAFDFALPPSHYLGHFIQHDEAASRDAAARVRAFLRRVLGDRPDTP